MNRPHCDTGPEWWELDGWWAIVIALASGVLMLVVAVFLPNRVAPDYRILSIEGHQYILYRTAHSPIHSESCTNVVHLR